MDYETCDILGANLDIFLNSINVYLFNKYAELKKQGYEYYQLNFSHRRILAKLFAFGASSTMDVAKQTHLSTKNIAIPIKQLAEAGLIRRYRNPEKRSVILLELTNEGRDLIDECVGDTNRYLLDIINYEFSEKEQHEMAECIDKLAGYFTRVAKISDLSKKKVAIRGLTTATDTKTR